MNRIAHLRQQYRHAGRVFALFSLSLVAVLARAQAQCTCDSGCYDINFATVEATAPPTIKYSWARVLAEKTSLRATKEGVLSESPWKIDTNHADYGLLVGPFVIWSQAYMDAWPNEIVQGSGIPGCVDLRSATVRIRVKLKYTPPSGEFDIRGGGHPKSARLLFWFQTYLLGRTVNYAYDQNLLDDALDGKEIALRLTDISKWNCLGGNRMFPDVIKYGCVWSERDLQTALSSVNVNMGLVLFLPDNRDDGSRISWLNSHKPLRTRWAEGSGSSFELTRFTIERPK